MDDIQGCCVESAINIWYQRVVVSSYGSTMISRGGGGGSLKRRSEGCFKRCPGTSRDVVRCGMVGVVSKGGIGGVQEILAG